MAECDVFVADEGVDNAHPHHGRICDIGRRLLPIAGMAESRKVIGENQFENVNENGEQNNRGEYAAPVDRQRLYPFNYVVSAGSKYEELITEKCDRDADQAGDQ